MFYFFVTRQNFIVHIESVHAVRAPGLSKNLHIANFLVLFGNPQLQYIILKSMI